MKKKLLSLGFCVALAVCLLIGFAITASAAETYTSKLDFTTNSTDAKTFANGMQEACSKYGISWYATGSTYSSKYGSNPVLVLNGANINVSGRALNLPNNTTVVTLANSTITSTNSNNDNTIFVNSDNNPSSNVTFDGTGKLVVTRNGTGAAIKADVIVNNGIISASSSGDYGILAYSSITNSGTMTGIGTLAGVYVANTITNSGTITASGTYGIYCGDKLTMSGHGRINSTGKVVSSSSTVYKVTKGSYSSGTYTPEKGKTMIVSVYPTTTVSSEGTEIKVAADKVGSTYIKITADDVLESGKTLTKYTNFIGQLTADGDEKKIGELGLSGNIKLTVNVTNAPGSDEYTGWKFEAQPVNAG